MRPTEGAKATCSLRAPNTPSSHLNQPVLQCICCPPLHFPPLRLHTQSQCTEACVIAASVSQHVWDTETEVHYMCRNERARCAHLSQQTKTKNNTSSSGTQQLGDRGRDARVSDGYLPLTVAVERCQMSTHSKRICNANESARVPSVCSNLCRTHNVLASSPLWPKVTLWTVSKGMSVLHVCVFRSWSTKSHDRIVTNVVRPLKGDGTAPLARLTQDSCRRPSDLLHLLLV